MKKPRTGREKMYKGGDQRKVWRACPSICDRGARGRRFCNRCCDLRGMALASRYSVHSQGYNGGAKSK